MEIKQIIEQLNVLLSKVTVSEDPETGEVLLNGTSVKDIPEPFFVSQKRQHNYKLISNPEDDPDLWCTECDVKLAMVDDMVMANHYMNRHEKSRHNDD